MAKLTEERLAELWKEALVDFEWIGEQIVKFAHLVYEEARPSATMQRKKRDQYARSSSRQNSLAGRPSINCRPLKRRTQWS
jgi:hypothetical protein